MSRSTASPLSPGAKQTQNVESKLAVTMRISVSARFLPTQLVRPSVIVRIWDLINQMNTIPIPKGANARLSRIISGRLYQRSGQNLWGSFQADSTISHREGKLGFSAPDSRWFQADQSLEKSLRLTSTD